jgi:hypothetical protein
VAPEPDLGSGAKCEAGGRRPTALGRVSGESVNVACATGGWLDPGSWSFVTRFSFLGAMMAMLSVAESERVVKWKWGTGVGSRTLLSVLFNMAHGVAVPPIGGLSETNRPTREDPPRVRAPSTAALLHHRVGPHFGSWQMHADAMHRCVRDGLRHSAS